MFQSLSDDLGHLIEASIMLVIFWALGYYFFESLWYAPVFVIGWYYGREVSQYEGRERRRLNIDSVKGLAYYSWQIWRWGRDGLRDFAVPVFYAFAVTTLLQRWI